MAVTAAPFWVTVAFQAVVTFVSPGKVKASVHPLTVLVPVLALPDGLGATLDLLGEALCRLGEALLRLADAVGLPPPG